MDKKTIRITGAQCSFSVGSIQENKETTASKKICSGISQIESRPGTKESAIETGQSIDSVICRRKKPKS